MLVKYFGLVNDTGSNSLSPRSNFLTNGLFRMTQPKYLNDQGSEARLWPYFNNFSPADYAWAKREYAKIQLNKSYIPSNEELENLFLKPTGLRYGDSFPHLLTNEGFKTMKDYDFAQLKLITQKINKFLVEAISCQLGILSLSKSDTNELMWTHYASDGRGLAVSFKQEHEFFKMFTPKDVCYAPERRASLTYYKGMVRLNGSPLKHYHLNELQNPINIINSLSKNEIDIVDLSERILYSKDQKWSYEDEVRVVCPLSYCEVSYGKSIKPQFEVELPIEMNGLFIEYPEVCLKQIPFDAFESIIFGYNTKESDRMDIVNVIQSNRELSHIKLQVAKHNIFGSIEITNY